MEVVWKGMETTESEGLNNMDCTEGHSDCRAGREEKLKSVAEMSRKTMEKTGTTEMEVGTGLKGRERAAATMFSEPVMWTISLVNSDIG